jgi:hypothetical protein
METAERFRFAVGDCVILNDVDQPSAAMVAVVTSRLLHGWREHKLYDWSYLNADPKFDYWSDRVNYCTLETATKLTDFGVDLQQENNHYWCQRVGESSAVYPDGAPRQWQDRSNWRHVGRPELMELIEQRRREHQKSPDADW